MISIALANPGEEVLIKRITGKDDVKHHVILQVKNGRIAIDRQLAMRIQM